MGKEWTEQQESKVGRMTAGQRIKGEGGKVCAGFINNKNADKYSCSGVLLTGLLVLP